MNKLFFNKKGQIAKTLTWFPAFVIIFFTMLLFIIMSSTLGLERKIPFFGEGFSEIVLEEKVASLENQKKLINLLNFPVGENKNLKELIIEASIKGGSFNEEVEKNVGPNLKDITDEDDCYLFEIDYKNENSKGEYLKVNEGIDRNFINVRKASTSDAEDFVRRLSSASRFGILSKGEKINILLFVQKC